MGAVWWKQLSGAPLLAGPASVVSSLNIAPSYGSMAGGDWNMTGTTNQPALVVLNSGQ